MRKQVLALIVIGSAHPVLAQTPPRFEVGLHLSILEESRLGEKPLGAGGGVTYRLSPYMSLDGAINRFPVGGAVSNFPLTQVVAGARVGRQFGRIGLFAKVRPGVSFYDQTAYYGLGSKPTLDIGAVFEAYASGHFGVRFDYGSAIIFYGNSLVATPLGAKTLGTRSNVQGSFGVFAHF